MTTDRIWRQLFGLVIVVLAVGIVLPILLGEPRLVAGESGGDPWRNIIFDFQALIAAGLALLAAKMTINQLQRTDKLQREQHNKLMKEARRPERNRIIAAAGYYPEELRRLAFLLEGSKVAMAKATDSTERLAALVFMQEQFREVADILEEPAFQRARDHFEPQLFNACLRVPSMANFDRLGGVSDAASQTERFNRLYHAYINKVTNVQVLLEQIAKLLEGQAEALRRENERDHG